MKTGIVSDIHGNLVALDAVLGDLRREGVDQVVCLGDVPAKGPYPHEVLERIRELGCVTVMGNTDASLLAVDLREQVEGLASDQRRLGEIFLWNLEQLTSDDRRFMEGFPLTATISLGDGKTLLCFHGSPRSCRDTILASTPTQDVEIMLREAPRADIYAGGHTHQQMLRAFGDATIINPGEIFGTRLGPVLGLTQYAIITVERGRLAVDFRRLTFDLQKVFSTARARKIPHVEWWVSNW